MRWLSRQCTDKTEKKIKESKLKEKQAKESYDRMMKSLHDLEDLLADDTDSRPDSKRG